MTGAIDTNKLYDAVIVGGGPAGLTAALYLARARYRVLVVERERFGGQITITANVVNYPGVASVSGTELTETMRRQAEAFGAEFLLAEVTELDLAGDVKHVRTSKGELSCLAVLLATGASPRHLGFAGEEEFRGRGVAYCATCDGEFFTGQEVFVVGGGFAAAEESVFLTKYARHVTVLVRGDDFTCAPAAAEEARQHEQIDVLYNTELIEAGGDDALRYLRYRNRLTGEETTWRPPEGETFGIFVFVGYAPATELVRGLAELDEHGYVLTDEHQMTTADGLFAAGDVCVKTLRQVATAVGQAAQTATDMERYIKAAQERTGLVPRQPVSRPESAARASGNVAAGPAGEQTGSHPSGASAGTAGAEGGSALFTPDMLAQLETVFARMERPLDLHLFLDDQSVSTELKGYMDELAAQTDKLSVSIADAAERAACEADELPCVQVRLTDGTPTGLAFHGVPGGHEFTSFVLGLYNAAGPGQPISDEDRAAAEAIDKELSIRVLVSLSCTMCPETVLSAQRIAALNPHVMAEAFDIAHFPALRERYHAMSVPCTVIRHADGREHVTFGKKNLAQLLEEIGR